MTDPALQLLDGVAWRGRPLPGDRLGALLAALALAPGGVSDASLADQVWAEDPPAHPHKALQVLVSRLRARTDAGVVTRYDGGYRLGLAAPDVDAWFLSLRVPEARAALTAGDTSRAVDLLDGVHAWSVDDSSRDGPLAELRARARRDLSTAGQVRGIALSRVGRHAEAEPLLVSAHRLHHDDAETLAALLRAEGATAGAAVALGRYEAYREDLADRLGIDPDPLLQRLHRELLAADDPVRTGLRFDGGGLLGREEDLARLRAALGSARLVTVLGPGGIGKTSVAQVLAHESTLPRVHVVELVGVGTGDDVVAAVGAALGVRGSVTTRHTLTTAQQADVRGRLAQELDAGPTLLVLDNCEHVLEPVAALVAFLLATTRDLRVLATSRAPLRLAAERAVPLSQLSVPDAEALFVQKATATRPDAQLDAASVRAVVKRLDGLPLAVELAAARVRTMTVAEVATALEDRFATLRTRDRSAPDRHRTLAAVIAWSWDLLTDPERRALARMSLFQDGFDRSAAAAVLGVDGPELVESLVEQSLLVVVEDGAVGRFRALETIREYGLLRLAQSGDLDAAHQAQDKWAGALCDESDNLFLDPDQLALVDGLVREEDNLTDVLRRALARSDAPLSARLLAALGTMWTITGNHPRLFSLGEAAVEVFVGWQPPDEVRAQAQDAALLLALHLSWLSPAPNGELLETIASWGSPLSAWAAAGHVMLVDSAWSHPVPRLAELADEATDPAVVGMICVWASIAAENIGEVVEAIAHVRRGLAAGPLPPYIEAALHSELAQLSMTVGDHREAAVHATRAWPVMERLHAHDDARTMRIGVALAHVLDGDPDACDQALDEIEADGDRGQLGSRMLLAAARAEAAIGRGDLAGGLAHYDEAVALVATAEVPGLGLTPWLAMAATGSLVAHVRFASEDRAARARDLRDLLRQRFVVTSGPPALSDLPFSGVMLAGLAVWALRWGPAEQGDDALILLALADAWSYNRTLPVLAWSGLTEIAERARPGALAPERARLTARTTDEQRDLAREVVARITSSG